MTTVKSLGAVIALLLCLSLSALGLIITDDGRVVFSATEPVRHFYLINDDPLSVTLNIAVSTRNSEEKTNQASSWIEIPDKTIMLPPYTSEILNIPIHPPKDSTSTLLISGAIVFQNEELFIEKRFPIYVGSEATFLQDSPPIK